MSEKQKILVIGASSYVGARIYDELRTEFDVTGSYYTNRLFPELLRTDIGDSPAVENLIGSISPDWIILAAAIPNEARCAHDPTAAARVNLDGVKNAVRAANSTAAKIIFISSEAAYDPTTIYGRLKKQGAEAVCDCTGGWVILEPGMVFGLSPNRDNDRPFNRLLRNLRSGEPAIYDGSYTFWPTYLGHLSEVCREIIARDLLNLRLPVIIPEAKTRFQVARDILGAFNLSVRREDKGITSTLAPLNAEPLKALSLPAYTYTEALERIIAETKSALIK